MNRNGSVEVHKRPRGWGECAVVRAEAERRASPAERKEITASAGRFWQQAYYVLGDSVSWSGTRTDPGFPEALKSDSHQAISTSLGTDEDIGPISPTVVPGTFSLSQSRVRSHQQRAPLGAVS